MVGKGAWHSIGDAKIRRRRARAVRSFRRPAAPARRVKNAPLPALRDLAGSAGWAVRCGEGPLMGFAEPVRPVAGPRLYPSYGLAARYSAVYIRPSDRVAPRPDWLADMVGGLGNVFGGVRAEIYESLQNLILFPEAGRLQKKRGEFGNW